MLEGVLWVFRTGAQWEDLPDRYPPHTTVHRRSRMWVRDGLATNLQEYGGIDVSECFVMIAPHRKNRVKPKAQGGQVLRRYKRRWKIEHYTSFMHLGCILILLRQDLDDF